MITFVHGPTNWNEKDYFWYDLESIGNSFAGPWFCLRDFNALVSQADKYGGRPVSASSSCGFQAFMLNSGLMDVGFVGNSFTWTNGQFGRRSIQERLDRGIANGEWRVAFPWAVIKHLPWVASDHAPLLLDTVGEQSSSPRPFRFEQF